MVIYIYICYIWYRSTNILLYFASYKLNMSLQEAKELVIRALLHADFFDLPTGGKINDNI